MDPRVGLKVESRVIPKGDTGTRVTLRLRDDVRYNTTEITVEGADLSIHASVATRQSSFVEAHVLNNGLYQFTEDIWFPRETAVPPEIIVDVHPHGSPEAPNYPFAPDREHLRAETKTAL